METETLADALPKECARVREVLGYYKACGPVGFFGASMIEAELRTADQAMASGDVIAMLRSMKALQVIEG